MQSNPYKPPASEVGSAPKKELSRESLAALVRSFLSSEITSFEFDERLEPYWDVDDPIIDHVLSTVWCYYDDCKDHFVCVSKEEWDHMQRLVLALSAANCQVASRSRNSWSLKQLLAGCSLSAFAYVAQQVGWGQHLWLLLVPFGIISILLSRWKADESASEEPYRSVICPFASFTDLAVAYRSSEFRKTKYPKHIGERQIRSLQVEWTYMSYGFCYLLWIVFSPIVLLLQIVPDDDPDCRVVVNR